MSKNKVNTKVLSGFVELLPNEQILFDKVKSLVETSYSNAGFLSIDTPAIEKSEVLFAKAGGETEKQVYRFQKGDNDLSLRFDLTVPFARYVSDHYNDITFPFKRYQIGKVYRGERAQKGRYREFYQADIDIVAETNLSVMYDFDIISTIYRTVSNLCSGFNLGNFQIKISNRKIWEGFFQEFNIGGDKKTSLMGLIDKKAKISQDVFDAELSTILKDKNIETLVNAMFSIDFLPGLGISIPEKYHSLFGFINTNEMVQSGFKELETVMNSLISIYADGKFNVDLSIIRGLDYYTGTVFETFLDDYQGFGSIASGGRYENLCDNYTDKKISGVGGSIGISRLFIPLIQDGKISNSDVEILDYLIIPQDENCYEYASKIKKILSDTNKKISIIFENKKFKKLMEYANKINANNVIIIGEDEVKNNTLTVKNMISGEQLIYQFDDIKSLK